MSSLSNHSRSFMRRPPCSKSPGDCPSRGCLSQRLLVAASRAARFLQWCRPPAQPRFMGYSSLRECVNDLEKHGHLRRIAVEIDPYLEMAEIHRRVYQAGGPALLFTRPKGCAYPMV